MPTMGFGRLSADITHEELVETVAKMQKLLDYFFQGSIDTKNIREIAGWLVSPNKLTSKDGDVGLSTEDTEADDIRIFAGAVGGDMETALFIVRKSGKTTIRTSSGYPRVEFDANGNLLAAYSDADTYIALIPNQSGVPTLVLVDGGTTKAFLNRSAGGTALGTFDGEPLNLQPSGPLQIEGLNGWNGTIFYVNSIDFVNQTYTMGSITVRKGIITNA